MSQEIDERVVSLQFDNRKFEKNTKQTMTTLQKLKTALKLDGATKGLEEVNDAANRLDFTQAEKSVDHFGQRFSALEVMGVTALANLTSKLTDAGVSLAKSLSVDQLASGWEKLETRTASMQTIMNATGKSSEEVAKYMDMLMWFSDETSFSFSEMLTSLSTAAVTGRDLEELIPMIEGIGVATAYAGKGGAEFSRVIFNLMQSFNQGYLSYRDWLSVVQAGVGSEQLIESLISTGEELGKLEKGTVTKSTFTSSLADRWADEDVMIKGLGLWASEMLEVYSLMENTDAFDTAGEAIDSLTGKYPAWIEAATDAAQKSKSFSEAIGAIKDAVSTGWMRTFQTLTGTFEESVELWGGLYDVLYDIFAIGSETRNSIFDVAFTNRVFRSADAINELLEPTQKIEDVLRKTDGLNADALAGEPTQYAKILKYQKEFEARQNRIVSGQQHGLDTAEEHYTLYVDMLKVYSRLSEEELRSIGYSAEQAEDIRNIAEQADKLGMSIEDVVDNFENLNGRWVLIDTLRLSAQKLLQVVSAIRESWRETFYGSTDENIETRAQNLYDIVTALHRFVESVQFSDDALDKLGRTLNGVFAILDLVRSIMSVPLQLAFSILEGIAADLGTDVLGLTAAIGDAIVKAVQWVKEVLPIQNGVKKISNIVVGAVRSIRTWVSDLLAISPEERVQFIIDSVTKGLTAFVNFIKNLFSEIGKAIFPNGISIGENIAEGIVGGLSSGATAVWNALISFAKNIIAVVKKVLGIHSPSTEFFDIAKNVLLGFWNGIKQGTKKILLALKEFCLQCFEVVSAFPWGKLAAVTIGVGFTAFFVILARSLYNITRAVSAFVDIGDAVYYLITGLKKAIRRISMAATLTLIAKAIESLAIAIGILAASLWVLSKIDSEKLWSSVGALAAVAAMIAGLLVLVSVLVRNIGRAGNLKDFGKVALAFLALSGLLISLVAVTAILGLMNPEKVIQNFAILSGMLAVIMVMIAMFSKSLTSGSTAGQAIISIGKVLALMVLLLASIKILGSMDTGVLVQGELALLGISGIISILMFVASRLDTLDLAKTGSYFLGLSAVFIALAFAIKSIGQLNAQDIIKGLYTITVLSVIIVGLIAATKLLTDSASIWSVGGLLGGIAAVMLSMALAIRLLGGMDIASLEKGIAVIAIMGVIIAGLMAITKIAGRSGDLSLKNTGLTLVLASVAIGILAGIAAILSLIDVKDLMKGVGAIAILATSVALLMVATSKLQTAIGPLVALTVLLSVLSGIAVGLSFIPTTNLISAVGALSALMIALAVMMTLFKNVEISAKTVLSITIMTAFAAAMVSLLALLSLIAEPKDILVNVLSTIILMTALVALVAILGALSEISGPALISLGALAVMLVLCGVAVAIIVSMGNIQNAEKNATTLSGLMASLAVILALLGALSPLIALSLPAVAILAFLIKGLVDIAQRVGSLDDNIIDATKKGMEFLNYLSFELGHILGNIVAGFVAAGLDLIPYVGTVLSNFMENATGFFDGVSSITDEQVNGVSNFCKMLLMISGTEIVDSIASFFTSAFTGKNAMETFAKNLSTFGEGIVKFSEKVDGKVNLEAVETASNAGLAIAEMANALPDTGLLSYVFGGNIKTFTKQMSAYADAIIAIGENLRRQTVVIPLEKLEEITKAGSMVSEFAKTLPEKNPFVDWGATSGTMSLTEFGEQMGEYVNTVIGIGETLSQQTVVVPLKKLEDVKSAGIAIAEVASALPGALDVMTREDGVSFSQYRQPLDEFAKMMPSYAAAAVAVSKVLNSTDSDTGLARYVPISEEQTEMLKSVGLAIAAVQNALPEDPSWLHEFFIGSPADLKKFGEQMISYITAVNLIAHALHGPESEWTEESIANFTAISESFGILAHGASELNTSGAVTGGILTRFGKDVYDFFKELKEIPNLLSTSNFSDLIDLINKTATLFSDFGLEQAKAYANGFISASDLIEGSINHIFVLCNNSVATTDPDVEALYESFKKCGEYLAQGFMEGIGSMEPMAKQSGSNLANGIVKTVMETLDEHSPSRVGEMIGQYFTIGVGIGIADKYAEVSDKASGIGDYIREGLARAISIINRDYLDDLGDDLVIRPVLDLSDISEKSGMLRSMLNIPSTTVTAARAISGMYNRREIQNGENDLANAIRDLKDSGIVGDTYIIDGIEYSNGSEVQEAIKTLIRATRLEDRV